MSDSIRNDEFPDGVAIIGMSGRFPGARNLDEFWRNLHDGVESISFLSDADLGAAGVDPAMRRDPSYVGAGGVLQDIDRFDAAFFGFNPREAEAMDPQHRLFLECAWETMENAGYDAETSPDSIGVYAGTGFSTYFFNVIQNAELVNLLGGHQIMIGNDKDHLTTHVSYKLNLRGPSIAVQTACSTSLVAVCTACRSLLDFQCDLALAGGSSVAVPQGRGYLYREGGIASPDGHCRPFDASARGTVAGNGVGVVLLKRYADALADRDHIRAVIRGTALNNDGAVKVGYTAPSVDGQAEVITMAHAVAGVNPDSITFIEAHGTGTPLGDPIEIAALAQVFSAVKGRNRCAVGSVKSNIGHLDTAAGIAGLIKTVLAIENRIIPPTLHFHQPNSKLNLDRTPFYINTKPIRWIPDGPRRAGVSSFGIGGTNAHVVMEEAPARQPSGPSRPAQLLVLSSKTPSGLDRLARLYSQYFHGPQPADIADASYTAAVGRKSFENRIALVCGEPEEASRLLDQHLSKQTGSDTLKPKHRPVVFLFSGQGSQYANMAAGLYRDEPVFRETMDVCLNLLEKYSNVAARSALFPSTGVTASANLRLAQTAVTQPVLFALEYTLARTFMTWGVKPESMIGHSVGEYVAACIAGVFPLEKALQLVALRGRLMQSLPQGAMLAVSAQASVVTGLMDRQLSLAALNMPEQCVISGPAEAIERAETRFVDRGIKAVRLQTSHAFHSAMMDPILPAFREAVRQAEPQPPSIPIVSNVTGQWLTEREAVDPQYWATHLRSCVLFAEGLGTILKEPGSVLLEMGPGQTLASFARHHPAKTTDTKIFDSVRRAEETHDDYRRLLQALGQMWVSGVELDWRCFYSREQRNRVSLPTYPFDRKRYWIDPPMQTAERSVATLASKNLDISDWFYLPSWKSTVTPEQSQTSERRNWLVFSEGAIGEAAAEALRNRKQPVVLVRRGDAFEALSRDSFALNPERESDYAALINRLHDEDKLPDVVLHCWSAQEGVGTKQALFQGFYSILFLARNLAGRNSQSEVRINMISVGLHSVLRGDSIEPPKATLLGPCIVIPQEQPSLRCRSIDLGLAELPAALDSLLDDCAAPIIDSVIAYRGGRRWVRGFEAVHWREETKVGSLLRQGGVYLITGGFGNVGLTLAETLAKHFGAQLVLATRTILPGRQTWDDWLSKHGTEERMSRRIRAVRELEALGGQVLVISCDVTDPGGLEAALEKTRATFGGVDGIIHAAAEMDAATFRPFTSTDVPNARLHFGPKISGTEILGEVLPAFKPAFCMLVSSISSVLGGLNLSAYAGANCFLDAFAERENERQQDTRWIAVNWDGWRFEGSTSRAELYLTPTEGAEVFRRILERRNATRVVISTGDLEGRLDRWVRQEPAAAGGIEFPERLSEPHERPELRTVYAKPGTPLEQMVADVWQSILGIEGVGSHDNFFEMGGHSLMAIQLVSRLRELLQVDIGLTALFEFPTVAQLANHIAGKLENVEGKMIDLAKMLDYVEGLSPEEVKALLARQPEN